MPALLPLFPLQLVVFPREKLNLHIFEPRYKQLIRECEEAGKTFGIPAYIDGKIKDVGTELKLVNIEKMYPKGEMDIRTLGIGLFKIQKRLLKAPGKLYSAAEVERLEFTLEGDYVMNEKILILVSELFQLLNINKPIPKDPNHFITYEIAHHVGLTLEQEYDFLNLTTEIERQSFLFNHLKRLIPIVKEMEKLREKVKMNGHFKNIIPPEFN